MGLWPSWELRFVRKVDDKTVTITCSNGHCEIGAYVRGCRTRPLRSPYPARQSPKTYQYTSKYCFASFSPHLPPYPARSLTAIALPVYCFFFNNIPPTVPGTYNAKMLPAYCFCLFFSPFFSSLASVNLHVPYKTPIRSSCGPPLVQPRSPCPVRSFGRRSTVWWPRRTCR